jgi:hypothetical protein
LNDPAMARELSQRGLRTIAERHTCAHRVDELLNIYHALRGNNEMANVNAARLPALPVTDETGSASQSEVDCKRMVI